LTKTKSILLGVIAALATVCALGFDGNNVPVGSSLPGTNLIAVTLSSDVTGSDSFDIVPVPRALWVGGAGDVVAIAQGDGATLNGATSANAATVPITTAGVGNPAPYSSAHPGQYVICADGTNATEIISGYIAAGASAITVTTGGGTGGNTTLNAHASGALVATYAPLKAANAGTTIPVRARRVLNTNTTATNLVGVY